jgi:hypothetical protein
MPKNEEVEIFSDVPKFKNGKWEILVFNQDGKITRTIKCDDKESADQQITDNKKQIDLIVSKGNRKNLELERNSLEQIMGDQNLDALPMDTLDPDAEEERLKKLKEFEEKFNKEETEIETEAKKLLLSIVKIYLDSKIITRIEYVQNKLAIEARGLANTLFQLKTARMAIFKISEEIHMGNTSPRMFEVLTGLQRVVLDISKFQHEYLGSLEESMKKLRMDILMDSSEDNMSILNSGEEGGAVAELTEGSESGKKTAISTNSRKTLLVELNSMLNEAKDVNKVPKSLNEKINDPNDEELVEAVEIKHDDGMGEEEEEVGSGLKTYGEDESPDQQDEDEES